MRYSMIRIILQAPRSPEGEPTKKLLKRAL